MLTILCSYSWLNIVRLENLVIQSISANVLLAFLSCVNSCWKTSHRFVQLLSFNNNVHQFLLFFTLGFSQEPLEIRLASDLGDAIYFALESATDEIELGERVELNDVEKSQSSSSKNPVVPAHHSSLSSSEHADDSSTSISSSRQRHAHFSITDAVEESADGAKPADSGFERAAKPRRIENRSDSLSAIDLFDQSNQGWYCMITCSCSHEKSSSKIISLLKCCLSRWCWIEANES